MTIRFRWVTDIPTPYRNHSFERMQAILGERGIDFEVFFMSWTEHRRPWRFRPEDLRFPHRLFSGVHPVVRGLSLHFNPGLLAELRRGDADIVMVGGYASPSHALAALAVHPRAIKILGCESNLASVARRDAVSRWVKRQIIQRYDAYLVPGRRSRELVTDLAPEAAERPFLEFPNTIDRAVFRDGVQRARADRAALRRALGVADGEQLWVCPARLDPEKGLPEFVPLLADVPNVRLLIAGEGRLRPVLERLIAERGLPVRLLGQQKEAEVVNLYAAADLFVLPSLRDPSPLSPIEASAACLPLFVSSRAGNVEDVLAPGRNGWLYDPDRPAQNAATVREIAATPPAELAARGRASGARYDERFDSDGCIHRLADGLVALHRGRAPARGAA